MSVGACGTTYSVTLLSAHVQCILVNNKGKGCSYLELASKSQVNFTLTSLAPTLTSAGYFVKCGR